MEDFKSILRFITRFFALLRNKTVIALDKNPIPCEILIIKDINYYYKY